MSYHIIRVSKSCHYHIKSYKYYIKSCHYHVKSYKYYIELMSYHIIRVSNSCHITSSIYHDTPVLARKKQKNEPLLIKTDEVSELTGYHC